MTKSKNKNVITLASRVSFSRNYYLISMETELAMLLGLLTLNRAIKTATSDSHRGLRKQTLRVWLISLQKKKAAKHNSCDVYSIDRHLIDFFFVCTTLYAIQVNRARRRERTN